MSSPTEPVTRLNSETKAPGFKRASTRPHHSESFREARPRRAPWSDGWLGTVFALVVDLFAILDAFWIGYLTRFQWIPDWPSSFAPPDPLEYLKAWSIGLYVSVMLFHAYGLYDPKRRLGADESVERTWRGLGIALVCMLSLSYFYRGFEYSRLSFIYSAVAALGLVGVFRWAWARYRTSVRLGSGYQIEAIMVGSRGIPEFLAERVARERSLGLQIVGVVDHDPPAEVRWPGVLRGRLSELESLVRQTSAREILIGHSSLEHHELLEVIEVAERLRVPVRMVPATFDLWVREHDFAEVDGVPLVTVNEQRSRPFFQAAKRIFDLVGAGLLLGLTLPIIAVCAARIRWDSPGAAHFRQRRVGKDGKIFTMFKLRTMRVNAAAELDQLVDLDQLAEPVFKLDNDPRVTRVGRLLRRLSLDELPQLVNVLRGEMSLVGPRPEQEEVVARYNIWERRRLKVKPGITGLQQIHCRGSKSLKERVRWDILYLRRESFFLDAYILLATIKTVILGKGTH